MYVPDFANVKNRGFNYFYLDFFFHFMTIYLLEWKIFLRNTLQWNHSQTYQTAELFLTTHSNDQEFNYHKCQRKIYTHHKPYPTVADAEWTYYAVGRAAARVWRVHRVSQARATRHCRRTRPPRRETSSPRRLGTRPSCPSLETRELVRLGIDCFVRLVTAEQEVLGSDPIARQSLDPSWKTLLSPEREPLFPVKEGFPAGITP